MNQQQLAAYIEKYYPLVNRYKNSLYIKDINGNYCYLNAFISHFLDCYLKQTNGVYLGQHPEAIFNSIDIDTITKIDEQVMREHSLIIKREAYQISQGSLGYFTTYKQPLIIDNQLRGIVAMSVPHNVFVIDDRSVVLSQRETMVFAYWLYGLSAKTTAKFMEISASSIETYIQRIKSKLQIYNKQNALTLIAPAMAKELFLLIQPTLNVSTRD